MLALGGPEAFAGQYPSVFLASARHAAVCRQMALKHEQKQHIASSRTPQQLQSHCSPLVTCSFISPAVAYATLADSKGRHAILHDFCMIIPYSSLILAAGLISIPFGSGWKGLLLASLGAFELFLTLQSLKQWQVGSPHRLFTATTAVISGGLTKYFWGNLQKGVAVWPSRLLLLCSAAATLFLVYNIMAGGNPPKEDPAITVQESAVPQKRF